MLVVADLKTTLKSWAGVCVLRHLLNIYYVDDKKILISFTKISFCFNPPCWISRTIVIAVSTIGPGLSQRRVYLKTPRPKHWPVFDMGLNLTDIPNSIRIELKFATLVV